jgi:cytochrome c peroxidase
MIMTKYRSYSTPLRPRMGALLLGFVSLTTGCGGDKDRKDAGAAAEAAKAKAAGAAQGEEAPAEAIDRQALLDQVKPILPPLPKIAEKESNPWTQEKADLGRMLYYDKRLSKNHDIACNTCHVLDAYGVDIREKDGKRTSTSEGHKGQFGDRNSPTVYNAALHTVQFWDGRAADVEEQAKGPVLNPVEMAMADEATVVEVLESIPGYKEKFKAAFPDAADPITYDNMANAIGAFERKLLTPSAYDEFLEGNLDALTDEQAQGLKTFVEVGCTTCHTGAAVGGGQFQKLGSVKPWPEYNDEGRFKVTKSPADKYMFKVPSLRNITKTAPYLHDGSIEDLDTMVSMMAEHQLSRGKLEPAELEAIVAFLGALEGKIPTDYIKEPELPESGPDTPKPDPS